MNIYGKCLLVWIWILMAMPLFSQTQVIAHRGFWDCEGSAQNSITALKKAQDIHIYGSEFDVLITSDGIPVVNHDDKINGLKIEQTPYAQLKEIRISNGEYLPTLESYLKTAKNDRNTRLILEIKPHSSKEIEDKAIRIILNSVEEQGLSAQVDYISFSLNICKELLKLNPETKIAYLNGDLTPSQVKELGLWGIDYHYSLFQKNKNWVQEAKDLNLTVNTWTVNDESVMKEMTDLGIDFITTDKPLKMAEVLKNNP